MTNTKAAFYIHFHGTQGGSADEHYETLDNMAQAFKIIVEQFPLLTLEAYIEFYSREYGNYTILVAHHDPTPKEYKGLKEKKQ